MKQKDVALIIVIAFISGVVSFLLSSRIFVTPSSRKQTVEVVDVINSSFETPSTKYFNSSSIDPTQSSTLGTDNNQNPFNGTSQ